MSAKRKAALYGIYKQHVTPEKHYRDYTEDELTGLLNAAGVDIEASLASLPQEEEEERPAPRVQDPDKMPSQRLNTQGADEILRVDEAGR